MELIELGRICYNHRKKEMKLTLKQFSELTGIKVKTLSAFENGRSSNIKIFYAYVEYSNKKTKLYHDLIKGGVIDG